MSSNRWTMSRFFVEHAGVEYGLRCRMKNLRLSSNCVGSGVLD